MSPSAHAHAGPAARGAVSCAAAMSARRHELERAMGIEPTRSAWKADVLPLNYARQCRVWTGRSGAAGNEMRSELVGRGGFEPPKAEPSDLQSDPFGRSGISPCGSP